MNVHSDLLDQSNIKLPITFRHESSVSISYHFFEIDKMISSKTCSWNLARKGLSLLGNEEMPIFLADQHKFLVIFYRLLQLRFTTNS